MTGAAWTLLGLAGLAMVADWVAVATARRLLEFVAKPLATLALVSVAIALDPVHADVRVAFVIALVLSLCGDVLLMLRGSRAFVGGLASFLLAHLAYVVGFGLEAGTAGALLVGGAVTLAVVGPLGMRLRRAVARTDPALVGPVTAYVLVIGMMVACASAWANPWAVAGAWMFLASDAWIGETRFVRPALADVPAARLVVMVTYHLAQAGLVVSLVHT